MKTKFLYCIVFLCFYFNQIVAQNFRLQIQGNNKDSFISLTQIPLTYQTFSDCEIAFIDGWTGKGVIARELEQSVKGFNSKFNSEVSSDLHVLSDPGGFAAVAGTRLDYLLPNAMLNATVSGLISRSFLTT